MDDPAGVRAVYRPAVEDCAPAAGLLSVIYVRDEMNIEFITPPNENCQPDRKFLALWKRTKMAPKNGLGVNYRLAVTRGRCLFCPLCVIFDWPSMSARNVRMECGLLEPPNGNSIPRIFRVFEIVDLNLNDKFRFSFR